MCVSACTCVRCVAAGQPVSSVQRQRFFDKPSNMQDVVFSTQHVYTFVITQSIVDMPTYK